MNLARIIERYRQSKAPYGWMFLGVCFDRLMAGDIGIAVWYLSVFALITTISAFWWKN